MPDNNFPDFGFKVGDEVTVKCIGIDDKGRVKMSIRAAERDAKKASAKEEDDSAEA